jgi:hypothetical protein
LVEWCYNASHQREDSWFDTRFLAA